MKWIAAIELEPECETSVIGCCDDDVFECRHYSEGVFFDAHNNVIDVDFWMPLPESPYQTGQIKDLSVAQI